MDNTDAPPDVTAGVVLIALAPAIALLLADVEPLVRASVCTLSEKEMREQYPESLGAQMFDWLARFQALGGDSDDA